MSIGLAGLLENTSAEGFADPKAGSRQQLIEHRSDRGQELSPLGLDEHAEHADHRASKSAGHDSGFAFIE